MHTLSFQDLRLLKFVGMKQSLPFSLVCQQQQNFIIIKAGTKATTTVNQQSLNTVSFPSSTGT
jgi:hypothetical protein